MKSLVSATMLATGLPALLPVVRAQDRSNWSNWDIRGTYTATGIRVGSGPGTEVDSFVARRISM